MKPVDPAEIVGSAEIAEAFGLASTSTVHDWRRRHESFPAPFATVSGVHLWRWSEVEAWGRSTGRLA